MAIEHLALLCTFENSSNASKRRSIQTFSRIAKRSMGALWQGGRENVGHGTHPRPANWAGVVRVTELSQCRILGKRGIIHQKRT